MATADSATRIAIFNGFFELVNHLKTHIRNNDVQLSDRQLQLVQGYWVAHRETLKSIVENELSGAFKYRVLSTVGRDCYLICSGDFRKILHNNNNLYLKKNRVTKLYEIVQNRNANRGTSVRSPATTTAVSATTVDEVTTDVSATTVDEVTTDVSELTTTDEFIEITNAPWADQ